RTVFDAGHQARGTRRSSGALRVAAAMRRTGSRGADREARGATVGHLEVPGGPRRRVAEPRDAARTQQFEARPDTVDEHGAERGEGAEELRRGDVIRPPAAV